MSQENKKSKIKSNAAEKKPAPTRKGGATGSKSEVLDGSERRLLWSARAFAILAALSVCLNVVMGVALAGLTPLIRVQPYLVNFQNKSEQIVTVTPINNSLEDASRVTERLVRQYVMLRHTIVPKSSEMERRWGVGSDLHYMSTGSIYKEFSSEEFRKGMDLLVSEGLSRGVEIGYVNLLPSSRTSWEVGFTTYDMYPQANEPKVKKWRAVVDVDYRPSRLSHRARFRNPLGFYVRRYSVSQDKV